MSIKETIIKFCGGSNSYESVKVGNNSHAEMTVSIRTNIQDISKSNVELETLGYIFGTWIIKRSSMHFCIGLYKALKEGKND